jgi:hypothetical protein
LLHIAHAVASLDEGLRVFEGLLGGRRTDDGGDGSTRWVELGWLGPGRLRLLEPATHESPVAAWLDGGRGRVHHLAFACADPASIAATTPVAGGAFEVAPEPKHGTRLLLTPA